MDSERSRFADGLFSVRARLSDMRENNCDRSIRIVSRTERVGGVLMRNSYVIRQAMEREKLVGRVLKRHLNINGERDVYLGRL